MRFRDIPKIPFAYYSVDVSFDFLDEMISRYIDTHNLIMNPDFQRGHVWTEDQQIAYVEWIVRGGFSGKDIFFNKPDWMNFLSNSNPPMVLVDGLQRLTASLKFMRNELGIFGGYKIEDFEDRPPITEASLKFHVNNLQTRAEVLQWYLDFNSGGTVHTKEELDKVRDLLRKENNE